MELEVFDVGGMHCLTFRSTGSPHDRQFLELLERMSTTSPGVLLSLLKSMQTNDRAFWGEIGRSVKELRRFIGFGPREFVELLDEGSPLQVAEYMHFEQGRGEPTRLLLANILRHFAQRLLEEKPERDENGVYYSLSRLVNESTARRFKG